MTVIIRGASMTLAHVPDLVAYGSKPARDIAADPSGEWAARLAAGRRSHAQAVAYPPNRAFIGALAPEVLWDLPRPLWRAAAPAGLGAGAPPVPAVVGADALRAGAPPVPAVAGVGAATVQPREPARRGAARGPGPESACGAYGEVLGQVAFLGLVRAVDRFGLVSLTASFADRARTVLEDHPLLAPHAGAVTGVPEADVEATVAGGGLALDDGGALVGAVRGDHEADDTLKPEVLLENLAAKATAVLALRRLLVRRHLEPEAVDHVLSCGEEAIGDRYQRGGGGLAKAVAEEAGCLRASGADVKAFCCAPVHALVLGASLIEAGVHDRVVVLAGGALAKLGMKSAPALAKGVPVLEDLLAGFAVLLERGGAGGPGPRLRLDCTGQFSVGAGSSAQRLYEDLCVSPLARLGMRIADVDRFAVELHDPEVTEPAGGGDVAARNYRMLGSLAVLRGELDRDGLAGFGRAHGLPGFSPTQGHIASAMPWLPHALDRLETGEIERTMLVAKGSLFLGRLTQLWDGASVLIDREE